MDYSEIANALVREIESSILLGLDTNFYKEAREFIENLEKKHSDVSDYEVKILRLSLEKLFLIRIKKAVEYIWRTGEKPNIQLPSEEAEIIDRVMTYLEEFKGINKESQVGIFPQIGGKEIVKKIDREGKKKRVQNILVFFIQPYTKLSIGEGRILGPFAKGDLAFIPLTIAKELEKKGVVEILG